MSATSWTIGSLVEMKLSWPWMKWKELTREVPITSFDLKGPISQAHFRYFNSIKFVKDFEKKTLPDFFHDYMTGNIDGISEKCTELALRMAQETAKASSSLWFSLWSSFTNAYSSCTKHWVKSWTWMFFDFIPSILMEHALKMEMLNCICSLRYSRWWFLLTNRANWNKEPTMISSKCTTVSVECCWILIVGSSVVFSLCFAAIFGRLPM